MFCTLYRLMLVVSLWRSAAGGTVSRIRRHPHTASSAASNKGILSFFPRDGTLYSSGNQDGVPTGINPLGFPSHTAENQPRGKPTLADLSYIYSPISVPTVPMLYPNDMRLTNPVFPLPNAPVSAYGLNYPNGKNSYHWAGNLKFTFVPKNTTDYYPWAINNHFKWQARSFATAAQFPAKTDLYDYFGNTATKVNAQLQGLHPLMQRPAYYSPEVYYLPPANTDYARISQNNLRF